MSTKTRVVLYTSVEASIERMAEFSLEMSHRIDLRFGLVYLDSLYLAESKKLGSKNCYTDAATKEVECLVAYTEGGEP